MTDGAPRTTRINNGLYAFDDPNGFFEVERFPDGSWMMFRITQGESGAEQREFEKDFLTKHEAVRWARSFAAWKPDSSEIVKYDGAGNLRTTKDQQNDFVDHYAICSIRDGFACDCDARTGPPGWKQVPIVPTDAMVKAGQAWWSPHQTPARRVWDAMLASAPPPQPVPAKVTETIASTLPIGATDAETSLAAEFRRLHEAARGCEFDLTPADGPIARLTLFVHRHGEALLDAFFRQRSRGDGK